LLSLSRSQPIFSSALFSISTFITHHASAFPAIFSVALGISTLSTHHVSAFPAISSVAHHKNLSDACIPYSLARPNMHPAKKLHHIFLLKPLCRVRTLLLPLPRFQVSPRSNISSLPSPQSLSSLPKSSPQFHRSLSLAPPFHSIIHQTFLPTASLIVTSREICHSARSSASLSALRHFVS
jgi:hypothetical protein